MVVSGMIPCSPYSINLPLAAPRVLNARGWWAWLFLFSAGFVFGHDPLSSWAILQPTADRLEFKVEMGAEAAWLFLGESLDHAPDIDHSMARLRERAAGVYRLSAGGKDLAVIETKVEQREEDGVVFRLSYARPAGGGPVRFEATFIKRLPAGHRTTLTLLDETEKVFRAEILNAAKPAVELPLPPAAARP